MGSLHRLSVWYLSPAPKMKIMRNKLSEEWNHEEGTLPGKNSSCWTSLSVLMVTAKMLRYHWVWHNLVQSLNLMHIWTPPAERLGHFLRHITFFKKTSTKSVLVDMQRKFLHKQSLDEQDTPKVSQVYQRKSPKGFWFSKSSQPDLPTSANLGINCHKP